ncbi:hypothetical protein C8Q78DRAFT_27257 [Trametes maxima]|nr:hypothetical protein C8Q78DRAFT_27257 [Trametes maxima]
MVSVEARGTANVSTTTTGGDRERRLREPRITKPPSPPLKPQSRATYGMRGKAGVASSDAKGLRPPPPPSPTPGSRSSKKEEAAAAAAASGEWGGSGLCGAGMPSMYATVRLSVLIGRARDTERLGVYVRRPSLFLLTSPWSVVGGRWCLHRRCHTEESCDGLCVCVRMCRDALLCATRTRSWEWCCWARDRDGKYQVYGQVVSWLLNAWG